MLRSPLGFLDSLPRHGGLARVRIGRQTDYVVCDPELTWKVLCDDVTFDKGGPLFEKLWRVAGDGIGFCPHDKHRPQRKMMQPSFSKARLRTYSIAMAEEISSHVDAWSPGQPVNIPRSTRELMSKITTRVIFGTDLDSDFLDSFDERITAVFQESFKRAIIPADWINRLPIPRNVRYEREVDALQAELREIIEQRHRAGDVNPDTLLASVLEFHEGDPKTLSDQLITLFIGGTGNSAMTLSWCLYLLAGNPRAEAALHEEIDSVLGNRAAGYDDLRLLPVTSRILMETLRLYPAGWYLSRVVTRDTELGGYELPKGASLWYSPYVLHRDPRLFPRPDEFDPDRWLEPAPQPRGAYIPFGAGARKCIGDDFAELEIMLTLVRIAARWTISSLSPRVVTPIPRVTINPSEFHLTFASRRGR